MRSSSTSTLVAEYRAQYAWRSWRSLYDSLPIAPGELVLDLGCAVGDQSRDLEARGARILGIDANAELLDAARERSIPNASFFEADLATWSDPTLGAAGLWCSFVPAYFPDFAPVLARWVTSLRHDAWIMLVEIDDLFGHEPLSADIRARFERFYDDALAARRYDFRMGRKARRSRASGRARVSPRVVSARPRVFFRGPRLPRRDRSLGATVRANEDGAGVSW